MNSRAFSFREGGRLIVAIAYISETEKRSSKSFVIILMDLIRSIHYSVVCTCECIIMWHVCVYKFARGRAYVCVSVCVHMQYTYLYLSSVSACLLLVWQIINLLTFFLNVFKLMGHKYLVGFPRGGMIQLFDLT